MDASYRQQQASVPYQQRGFHTLQRQKIVDEYIGPLRMTPSRSASSNPNQFDLVERDIDDSMVANYGSDDEPSEKARPAQHYSRKASAMLIDRSSRSRSQSPLSQNQQAASTQQRYQSNLQMPTQQYCQEMPTQRYNPQTSIQQSHPHMQQYRQQLTAHQPQRDVGKQGFEQGQQYQQQQQQQNSRPKTYCPYETENKKQRLATQSFNDTQAKQYPHVTGNLVNWSYPTTQSQQQGEMLTTPTPKLGNNVAPSYASTVTVKSARDITSQVRAALSTGKVAHATAYPLTTTTAYPPFQFGDMQEAKKSVRPAKGSVPSSPRNNKGVLPLSVAEEWAQYDRAERAYISKYMKKLRLS